MRWRRYSASSSLSQWTLTWEPTVTLKYNVLLPHRQAFGAGIANCDIPSDTRALYSTWLTGKDVYIIHQWIVVIRISTDVALGQEMVIFFCKQDLLLTTKWQYI